MPSRILWTRVTFYFFSSTCPPASSSLRHLTPTTRCAVHDSHGCSPSFLKPPRLERYQGTPSHDNQNCVLFPHVRSPQNMAGKKAVVWLPESETFPMTHTFVNSSGFDPWTHSIRGSMCSMLSFLNTSARLKLCSFCVLQTDPMKDLNTYIRHFLTIPGSGHRTYKFAEGCVNLSPVAGSAGLPDDKRASSAACVRLWRCTMD